MGPAPLGARWAALQPNLPVPIYAGAPYIRQVPSGATVLSVHSADGRNSPGTLDYSRMVVYVGDSTAHGFAAASEPFPAPPDFSGLWKSLFIKNALKVNTLSGTTLNGISGLWAIDGHLQELAATPSPSITAVTNLASGLPGPYPPANWCRSPAGLVPASPQGGAVTASFNGVPSSFPAVVSPRSCPMKCPVSRT